VPEGGALSDHSDPVFSLRDVCVLRSGRLLLDRVTWEVGPGERWVVLGPNGSGKTTLLRVIGARLWPTGGEVDILGQRVGTVDLRSLRARVALVSGAVLRELRQGQPVRDVIASGKFGALETWWHHYEPSDFHVAQQRLEQTGVASAQEVFEREFGVVSEGERQHVLLARALMSQPELLLLDEPAAGLDMGARERLILGLGRLATDEPKATVVLVTHHAEEIPSGVTHALLLASGHVVHSGPINDVLTSEAVSSCFSAPLTIGREGTRWWCRAD
jgi:iron complex transport system ATP-binding protein